MAQQVDVELLTLAEPVALLTDQVGLGLDDAQRHALAIGAEPRHRLAQRQCVFRIEVQSFDRLRPGASGRAPS
jgi:hypothetical protein